MFILLRCLKNLIRKNMYCQKNWFRGIVTIQNILLFLLLTPAISAPWLLRIISFYNTRTIPEQTPIEPRWPKVVQPEILSVIKKAVKKNYAVKIRYKNGDGIKSFRRLTNLTFTDEYGYEYRHINAYCHKRKSIRTFNLIRVKTVKIVEWKTFATGNKNSPGRNRGCNQN